MTNSIYLTEIEGKIRKNIDIKMRVDIAVIT